jgi:hypothetical protein
MLDGLSDLEQQGQPVPDWVLGGRTALMLHAKCTALLLVAEVQCLAS